MEVVVSQSLYPPGCIILSVQKYLAGFHVTISADGDDIRISFTPKDAKTNPPDENEYLNHLIHSAFRYQHERETAELRRLLLDRAFSIYR